YGPSAGQNGSIYKLKTQVFSHNFLQLLRYKTDFGDHGLEAFVAHESNFWERQYMFASTNNLAIPWLTELNSGVVGSRGSSYSQSYTLESYFGQVNYDFDKKYFLSGTLRRDGSSRFVEGNKWGTFGSVSAAWVASREDFMDNQEIF